MIRTTIATAAAALLMAGLVASPAFAQDETPPAGDGADGERCSLIDVSLRDGLRLATDLSAEVRAGLATRLDPERPGDLGVLDGRTLLDVRAALGCTGEPPATDEPGTDEPGTDTPGTDEPGTDEPGTDEPGTDEPAGPTEAELRAKLCASTEGTVGEFLDANATVSAELRAYLDGLNPVLDEPTSTVVAAQLAAECGADGTPITPQPTTPSTGSNTGSGSTGSTNPGQFESTPSLAPETGR